MHDETMLQRVIPSSGERIPAVGMGTWQSFDVAEGDPARATLATVLQRFVALGGAVVDSSPMYGRSEEAVGAVAAETGTHERLFLATKVWTRGRAAGVAQMERSFELLRVDRIDLMQVHNLLDVETHLRTIAQWQDEGRIRYTGVTHYQTSAYDDLERALESQPIDFAQFNYNIAVREAERRLLPFCAERGVAVLVNRPYEEGALFRAVRGRPLPGWVEEFDCTSWGQFFLAYILSHPAVTCIIPATSDPAHLEDNMAAGRGRLPDETLRRRMAALFDSL
jgi:diketogulonate reductase-like aldo/keto reductase